MRGDLKAAEGLLAKVDSPQRKLELTFRRASLMQRQGKLSQARELIWALPENSADEARAKVMAESQLLRDARDWKEAYAVLERANKRINNDTDLLYEQAMMSEKLGRFDEMETLLKRVTELKPEHYHAYNALGYSLADRNIRLSEARELISKALSFSPTEPYILDSMGWVEFRLGHQNEAVRLLSQAFAARQDAEIAAHLGEVLWVGGEHDDARRVWREGAKRDPKNEALSETLSRLKASP
jgi:tetratricopeptide (TPR) repeat protein